MKIIIQPYEDKYRDGIRMLNDNCFPEHYDLYDETLVAINDQGEAVGYISICACGKPDGDKMLEGSLYIGLIAVEPAHKGKGISDKLLEAAERSFIKSQKLNTAFNAYAHVHPRNYAAVLSFQRAGYKIFKKSILSFGSNSSLGSGRAYLMAKKISSGPT